MIRILGTALLAFLTIGQADCDPSVEFALNNKNFAVNFFEQILKKPDTKGKNIVFSPYSIQTAGALLFAGADGITASEMVTGFNLPSSDAAKVGETFKANLEDHQRDSLFKIANKIYVANGFSVAPAFSEIATKSFHSDVESIKFRDKINAANSINKWIETNTGGKIRDLVQPDTLDEDSRILLANAIHFKGSFKQKFNKEATAVGDFYSTPNDTIKTELMHVTEKFKFDEFSELGVRVAEYPFNNTDVTLFFLLPDTVEKSLDEVEAKLSDLITKEDIFNKLSRTRLGRFTVPKFKIGFELDMEESFKNMGMSSLFGSTADFSKLLSPAQPLYVSKALHKASIEVNEEGAEAAAATVSMTRNRLAPIKFPFTINQSFLYFVKGANGEIYFMGRFTGK